MDPVIRNAHVLVAVKAYPNPSRSHIETVCTAGLLEGERWIRIYPVSFRFLQEDSQYPKYGWITLDLQRRFKDFRPESYMPNKGEQEEILLQSRIPPGKYGWAERKRLLLREVYYSMDELIEKAKGPERISLGMVKPTSIDAVTIEAVER